MFVAFLGSFCGDQTYYYIGRRYGTPLLKRWPTLTRRVEWAFKMVRTHETLFILSFRFIYGVRNISPFVIGMAGVGRLKFFILNMIAALAWANTFAWGGYFLGRALEDWLGTHKLWVLGGFVLLLVLFGVISTLNQRRKARKLEREKAAMEAEAAAAQPPATTALEAKSGDDPVRNPG
jgi:membrane protein DedA with SNARE-associated domain